MIASQTACEVPSEIDIIRRCQTNLTSIQISSQNIITSHIFLHSIYQSSKASVDILLTRNCLTDIEVVARLVACLTFLNKLRQRDCYPINIFSVFLDFRNTVNWEKHFLSFTWFDFDKVVWQIFRHGTHWYQSLVLVIIFTVKLNWINISEGDLLIFELKFTTVCFKFSDTTIVQFICQLGFQSISCVVIQLSNL